MCHIIRYLANCPLIRYVCNCFVSCRLNKVYYYFRYFNVCIHIHTHTHIHVHVRTTLLWIFAGVSYVVHNGSMSALFTWNGLKQLYMIDCNTGYSTLEGWSLRWTHTHTHTRTHTHTQINNEDSVVCFPG